MKQRIGLAEAHPEVDLTGRSKFIFVRQSEGRRKLTSRISIPKIPPVSSISINIPSCNLRVLLTFPSRNWIYKASACSSKLIFIWHLLRIRGPRKIVDFMGCKPIGSKDNIGFLLPAVNYLRDLAQEFLSSRQTTLKAGYNMGTVADMKTRCQL